MTNTEIISGLAAFLLSAVLGPVVIPVLRRIKAGQTEREDGPESHLKKTGTPTMGAFIFLIPFIAVFTVVSFKEPGLLPVLFLTAGFAVVGFVEDYHHHSWCGIVLYDVFEHSPQIRQPAAELGISLL